MFYNILVTLSNILIIHTVAIFLEENIRIISLKPHDVLHRNVRNTRMSLLDSDKNLLQFEMCLYFCNICFKPIIS